MWAAWLILLLALAFTLASWRHAADSADREAGLRFESAALDVADIGTCCVDARKVRQILGQLMSNAVKFTPEGGRVMVHAGRTDPPASGAITAAGIAEAVRPDSAQGESARWLEIAVSDTGIGIAAADLELLFEPFSQIDASLTRRFGGTGLGLALARSLAAEHGGTVTVNSEPGKGSTFTVLLPCRPPTPVSQQSTADARP